MIPGRTYKIVCKDKPDIEVYGIFETETSKYNYDNVNEFFEIIIKPAVLKELNDNWDEGVRSRRYNNKDKHKYMNFMEKHIVDKLTNNKPHCFGHCIFSDYYYFSQVYADNEENLKIFEYYYEGSWGPIYSYLNYIADNEFTIAFISKYKFEFELMPEPEFKNGAAVDD